jgi:hypothetical protein
MRDNLPITNLVQLDRNAESIVYIARISSYKMRRLQSIYSFKELSLLPDFRGVHAMSETRKVLIWTDILR